MKKKIYILMFQLISMYAYSQNPIRVNGTSNFQDLLDNSPNNSIFLVENGSYGEIFINKPAIIIGTGFLLSSNQNVYFSNIYVNADAVNIQGVESTGTIYVGANNSMLDKIKANQIYLGRKKTSNNVFTSPIIQNPIVKRSYLNKIVIGSWGVGITDVKVIEGKLLNNIFWGSYPLDVDGSSSLLFDSNTFIGPDYFWITREPNIVFNNNLFTKHYDFPNAYYSLYKPTVKFYYNFCNGFNTQINNGTFGLNNTLVNSNGSTFFLAYPNNPNNLQEDARYQLHPNSPAKGAGENGTDAGAFGGDEPYVLSGIPSIPTIYQLTVPANVPQGGILNVQIKAKTNN